MAEYLTKMCERRKAMAEEEDVLIFCKKRKLCSEHGNLYCGEEKLPGNLVSSAASVAIGCSEDDESSNDVQKGLRSPDLENVDSETETEPEGFGSEISTPCSGGFSNHSRPTSELCGVSEEVSMGSSTSKKKKSSQLSQEVKSRRNLASSAAENMRPSAAEIEEFFAAAEKCEQKRFAEKYNYDILKDVPLEGRYQWVRLQP